MTRPVSIGINLTADVAITVYKVPLGYFAKWNLMYLFNNTGSTKASLSIGVMRVHPTNIYVQNGAIPSKEYIRLDGNAYVVLEENDTLVMQAEAGSYFSTICTFELFKKEGI